MREQTALERFSIAWMANLAQRRGTRRTPLYPPFARGEKDQTPPTFPPLRRGGRGGESCDACNASENRSTIAVCMTVFMGFRLGRCQQRKRMRRFSLFIIAPPSSSWGRCLLRTRRRRRQARIGAPPPSLLGRCLLRTRRRRRQGRIIAPPPHSWGRRQRRKRIRLLPVFLLRPMVAVVAKARAVAVPVPISIPAVRVADSVHYHPEHGGSQVVEEFPGARRVMVSQRRGMDDDDHSIGHGAENRRVGHVQDRRAVDDDHVVGLTEFFQEFLQSGRREKLGRVVHLLAGGDDVQVRDRRVLYSLLPGNQVSEQV